VELKAKKISFAARRARLLLARRMASGGAENFLFWDTSAPENFAAWALKRRVKLSNRNEVFFLLLVEPAVGSHLA
jgi:hypothetical protein